MLSITVIRRMVKSTVLHALDCEKSRIRPYPANVICEHIIDGIYVVCDCIKIESDFCLSSKNTDLKYNFRNRLFIDESILFLQCDALFSTEVGSYIPNDYDYMDTANAFMYLLHTKPGTPQEH